MLANLAKLPMKFIGYQISITKISVPTKVSHDRVAIQYEKSALSILCKYEFIRVSAGGTSGSSGAGRVATLSVSVEFSRKPNMLRIQSYTYLK